MEKELPMFVHQLSSTELCSFSERPLHGITAERDPDPTIQGVDTEEVLFRLFVPYKRIVSVPDKRKL